MPRVTEAVEWWCPGGPRSSNTQTIASGPRAQHQWEKVGCGGVTDAPQLSLETRLSGRGDAWKGRAVSAFRVLQGRAGPDCKPYHTQAIWGTPGKSSSIPGSPFSLVLMFKVLDTS